MLSGGVVPSPRGDAEQSPRGHGSVSTWMPARSTSLRAEWPAQALGPELAGTSEASGEAVGILG